jgi:dipeptidyl-peptidase-4
MLKQVAFLALFIFGSIFTHAQKKELSLEDAVLQQYRSFASDKLDMFQWIPTTSEYTYLDGYVTLMIASAGNSKAKELLTIQKVNEVLSSNLRWFSGMEWKNKDEFWLNDGLNFYLYNVKKNSGKVIAQLGEGDENAILNKSTKGVAYTRDNNVFIKLSLGEELSVTQNSDKNIVSGQAIARSEFGIRTGLFWSDNGAMLAFYQKDETFVHDYPLLDISTTPGSIKSIKYPMAGQKSEHPRVGIYNVGSKQVVYISPRGEKDDYLTNLSWTPDGKFVTIAEVNRDQDHMWLNVYDALTGEFVKTLLEETSDKWTEPEHVAHFPLKNSTNFIWISEEDGFNNLYYYDFNGKLIKKLTQNKFVAKEIIQSTEDDGMTYFYATGDNGMNNLVYAVDLNGNQQLITHVGGVHSVVISENGKQVMDQYSNHSIPGVSQILDSKGKIRKVVVDSPNKLDEYQIGNSEIIKLRAKDSAVLYSRLIKPSNFDPSKKYPVLVYVYGGPHAQLITNSWLDGSSLWMQWMAEQGYLIYTLDNHGSAHRGVAFETPIHRQLGNLEMEDQLIGVDYLKSLPYVDADRLAVHGWSFGGFMTTSMMLRLGDTFKVGVAGGPVTDWKYYEAMYGERYMDRPQQNKEGYEQASLMTHAGNLQGDLLLIHGTVDDVVVMQHNLALVKKFVDLGIQMDFFPYPMHKHNVGGKDRVHLMTKVLNYVIEQNK